MSMISDWLNMFLNVLIKNAIQSHIAIKVSDRNEIIDFGQSQGDVCKFNFWKDNFSTMKSTPERVQTQPVNIKWGKRTSIKQSHVLLL